MWMKFPSYLYLECFLWILFKMACIWPESSVLASVFNFSEYFSPVNFFLESGLGFFPSSTIFDFPLFVPALTSELLQLLLLLEITAEELLLTVAPFSDLALTLTSLLTSFSEASPPSWVGLDSGPNNSSKSGIFFGCLEIFRRELLLLAFFGSCLPDVDDDLLVVAEGKLAIIGWPSATVFESVFESIFADKLESSWAEHEADELFSFSWFSCWSDNLSLFLLPDETTFSFAAYNWIKTMLFGFNRCATFLYQCSIITPQRFFVSKYIYQIPSPNQSGKKAIDYVV